VTMWILFIGTLALVAVGLQNVAWRRMMLAYRVWQAQRNRRTLSSRTIAQAEWNMMLLMLAVWIALLSGIGMAIVVAFYWIATC